MAHGVRPTAEQIAILARFPTRALARETDGLARETAASAKRVEPITRVNLRSLLEAAARLEARGVLQSPRISTQAAAR